MKNTKVNIIFGAALSITLLAGCTPGVSPATSSSVSATAEIEAPKAGTKENPLPIGGVIDSTSDHVPIAISFPALNTDANEAVILPGFVPEPDPGFHWVVLTVQIANTSTDSSDLVSAGDIGATIHLSDASGQQFDGSFAYLVEGLDVVDDPYGGETTTGEMAYQVPDGATSLIASYKGIFVVVL